LEHFLQDGTGPNLGEPALIRQTEQEAANKQQPELAQYMTLPAEQLPGGPPVVTPSSTPVGSLAIGGKLTVAVLLYGDFFDLHQRCVNSILATVPADRLDLRIAGNQLGGRSERFVQNLPATKLYLDCGSRRKYPAMRQMFYDPDCPIETTWLCWFDDDSYVRSPAWLTALSDSIAQLPRDGRTAMFGQCMFHPLRAPGKDPRTWFQQASWYRGRPFRDRRGAEAPNGDCIHFITGGFWCVSVAALKACDIPDIRLNHNGGDICIGEQLWQNGYRLQAFNPNKTLIHTSAHARRGYREKLPWL
jgi:hypothetical protein